jgi:hypothetical protein
METINGLDLKKLSDDYIGSILISGLPLPPTDNKQYKTIVRRDLKARNGYKTLRVKSDTALKYKKQFSDWALVNAQAMARARKAISQWGETIELQLFFAMEENKLLTIEEKRLKKIDANNRDKALQDCLADTLRIDDSRFVITRLEKVISAPNGEQVLAILTPKKLRTLAEVFQSLETRVI